VPAAPGTLGTYGREYWERIAPLLVRQGALTELHLEALEAMCDQWEVYQINKVWLLGDPKRWTFRTESGYEQETPAVRAMNGALAALQKLWPKFGLTPHAAGILGKGGKGQPVGSPLADFASEKTRDDEAMRP